MCYNYGGTIVNNDNNAFTLEDDNVNFGMHLLKFIHPLTAENGWIGITDRYCHENSLIIQPDIFKQFPTRFDP